MRVRPAPVSPRYPKIRFAFTDHPITALAGAILLRLSFELIRLRASLAPLRVPCAKTSNTQIPTVGVLLAWWYGLALGAERFAHLTGYRRDPLLPQLLGAASVPFTGYPAVIPCGLHVPTDHRAVGGPDADVVAGHATDSAGACPG